MIFITKLDVKFKSSIHHDSRKSISTSGNVIYTSYILSFYTLLNLNLWLLKYNKDNNEDNNEDHKLRDVNMISNDRMPKYSMNCSS
jgi:hypothetical protein